MPTWGNRWRSVGDPVGEGGAGRVYTVRDLGSPDGTQIRALKELKNTRPDRLQRFAREVEVLRRVRHPNVLELVDANLETDGERPYFVTEFCDGGHLVAPPLDGPALPLLDLFRQIVTGVAALHEAGGVHRDIKPENVLLRGDGTPVVADFGIAFLFDDDAGRVTEEWEQVGSRFFICPENEEGRVAPSKACDIYSLGKLLYWLLTSGSRFARGSHRGEGRNIVTIRRDYYLEHINAMMDRMIDDEPERRIPTANELLDELRRACDLITGRFNPLTRADQCCRYCGLGWYERMRDDDYFSLGIDRRNPHVQIILRCDHCGHVDLFFTNQRAGNWIDSAGVRHRR